MQRTVGAHFYINIANFNQIILEEEKKNGRVTHAIHALDTFFSSIERYGKKLYPKEFVVEKITGSRLHLYVTSDIAYAYKVVVDISFFAYKLARFINTGIPKYEALSDFKIQVGADYGRFYPYEFISEEGYSELTTIGYVANFAAKLQSLTGSFKISISENIYNSLTAYEQQIYSKVEDNNIEKYEQSCYYTARLFDLTPSIEIPQDEFNDVADRVNSIDLKDIEYSRVRQKINFENITKTQVKELQGIPLYADVRGFTCQFKEDDSNLDEMVAKAQSILQAMYQSTIGHGGIHIQFQGDRELSLYHNIPAEMYNGVRSTDVKCFKSAVLAAMRLVDTVKGFGVHIGVGADFGRLFATKFGTRGEKDNILLGETVITADAMEDKCAAEDQIAITNEVYMGLLDEDRTIARQFKKVNDAYYIATIGYKQYMHAVENAMQQSNTTNSAYNGAWGDLS